MYQSDKIIKKDPSLSETSGFLIPLLKLRVLCSNASNELVDIIEANGIGKTLGEIAVKDLSPEYFNSKNSLFANLTKVVKKEDISKGLENFNRITKLIEK